MESFLTYKINILDELERLGVASDVVDRINHVKTDYMRQYYMSKTPAKEVAKKLAEKYKGWQWDSISKDGGGTEAFQKGYKAGKSNENADDLDNPYKSPSQNYKDWIDGRDKGSDERYFKKTKDEDERGLRKEANKSQQETAENMSTEQLKKACVKLKAVTQEKVNGMSREQLIREYMSMVADSKTKDTKYPSMRYRIKDDKVFKLKAGLKKTKDAFYLGQGNFNIYSSLTGEVFITGIATKAQAEQRLKVLWDNNPNLKNNDRLVIGELNGKTSKDSTGAFNKGELTTKDEMTTIKIYGSLYELKLVPSGVEVFENGVYFGKYDTRNISQAIKWLHRLLRN